MKSDKGEFLPIHNSRILLETIEKRLDLHKPLSGSILSITFQQLLSLQTEPWHLSCMTGNSLIWWQRLPKVGRTLSHLALQNIAGVFDALVQQFEQMLCRM